MVKKPMDACDRGNWIDTEGRTARKEIRMVQTERGVLDEYCESAKADGVPCKVKFRPKLKQYKALRVRVSKHRHRNIGNPKLRTNEKDKQADTRLHKSPKRT
jgi:hypothetical protein